jgi:hypothetical protein
VTSVFKIDEMWLFRKRREIRGLETDDKVAMKIARTFIKAQIKFANLMNYYSSRISLKRMRLMSYAFCFVGTGMSLYYIAIAILKNENLNHITIEQAKVPVLQDSNEQVLTTNGLIDEESWKKISCFKRTMDSLRDSGSSKFDSMVLARPGLMDSLELLKEMYYSQKK